MASTTKNGDVPWSMLVYSMVFSIVNLLKIIIMIYIKYMPKFDPVNVHGSRIEFFIPPCGGSEGRRKRVDKFSS